MISKLRSVRQQTCIGHQRLSYINLVVMTWIEKNLADIELDLSLTISNYKWKKLSILPKPSPSFLFLIQTIHQKFKRSVKLLLDTKTFSGQTASFSNCNFRVKKARFFSDLYLLCFLTFGSEFRKNPFNLKDDRFKNSKQQKIVTSNKLRLSWAKLSALLNGILI